MAELGDLEVEFEPLEARVSAFAASAEQMHLLEVAHARVSKLLAPRQGQEDAELAAATVALRDLLEEVSAVLARTKANLEAPAPARQSSPEVGAGELRLIAERLRGLERARDSAAAAAARAAAQAKEAELQAQREAAEAFGDDEELRTVDDEDDEEDEEDEEEDDAEQG